MKCFSKNDNYHQIVTKRNEVSYVFFLEKLRDILEFFETILPPYQRPGAITRDNQPFESITIISLFSIER